MIYGLVAIITGILLIIFSKRLTSVFFIHGGLGTVQKNIPNSKMVGSHIRIRVRPTVENYYGEKPLGSYLIKLVGVLGIIFGILEVLNIIQ